MIKYKQVVAKNGRTMYYRNGTMVSKAEIPENILNNLDGEGEISVSSGENAPMMGGLHNAGGTVDGQTLDQPPVSDAKFDRDTTCIFCGEPGTRTRHVNLQTAYLCDEDYESHTLGKIAAQLRNRAPSVQ